MRDQAPHKPNEWFTQEVICMGDTIAILVNGKKTIEWTDSENRWKGGHFALQGHDPNAVVKFRKIEVKELTGTAVAGKAPSASPFQPARRIDQTGPGQGGRKALEDIVSLSRFGQSSKKSS